MPVMRRGLSLAAATALWLVTMPLAPATALCAPHSPAGSFMRAEVVFTGRALEGPNVQGMLTDPVRFTVAEYQKGSGPRIIQVETGTTGSGNLLGMSSVGLTARAGARFQIFGKVEDGVVKTSSCAGSRALKRRQVGFAAAQTPGGQGVLDATPPSAPAAPIPGSRVVGVVLVSVLLTGGMVLVARRRPPALS
jgi:hypothetical protein